MTGSRSTGYGRALCLLGASVGVVALVGWLVGVEAFYSALPGAPPMMPNTAISALLLGIAGAMRYRVTPGSMQQRLSLLAAIVVLIINVATLTEYAFDVSLGLDELFLHVPPGPYSAHLYPGRSSPPSATVLALLSAAVVMFVARPAKSLRVAEWLILTAVVLGCLTLLGDLFGVGPHYHLTGQPAVGSSIPTALAVLLISFGLLLERPGMGVMRVLTSQTSGGVLLRRLGLVAVLTPLVSGLIASKLLQFTSLSNVDIVDFLFAAFTVVSAVASLFLVAITATRVDHAQDALAQNQRQTRDLINLASDGFFLADLQGRYIDVNEAGCQMLGYTREEILHKTIMDLIAPEDLPRLEDQKNKLIRGAVRLSNWDLVCKDGRLLPTEISTKILPDGRWQAFVRDISERKRADEEIRLSEAKFSGIVSISADAIISIDEHQHISLFNEGAEKIFGWSSAEVIGRPLEVLIPQRFRVMHARQVETFADQGGAARRMGARGAAVFGIRKNGQEFPADAAISGIVVGGRRLLTVSLRDITELKQAEAVARQAAQARDDILGIVAHDLRNPLSAIDTLAQVLRMKGLEVEVGDEIADATRRMNRLIGDLLDVTSMEAGHLSLKQQRIPAAEVITDALEEQKTLASSASLLLRLDRPRELPDVWADRDRLLQIFQNLIGNAIKFTKPGGQITLGASAGEAEVTFSVSDTGRGIASTHLPHVFNRFWQAPGTERRGMGFGLAIVKGIVEAHGGHVWVTSSPGRGSTFFFTIPTAEAQTALRHAAQGQSVKAAIGNQATCAT